VWAAWALGRDVQVEGAWILVPLKSNRYRCWLEAGTTAGTWRGPNHSRDPFDRGSFRARKKSESDGSDSDALSPMPRPPWPLAIDTNSDDDDLGRRQNLD